MDTKPTMTLLSELDADKQKLVEYCQNLGLLPHQGTYMCPKCGNCLKLQVSSRCPDGYHWVCNHKLPGKGKNLVKCDCRVSLRTNTIFANSRLSIKNIVVFATMWVQSYRQSHIMWQLDVSKQTITDWASFCREVAYKTMVQYGDPIGGEGTVVEIDKSKFTKHKYHRGRIPPENWVFGGYERGSGRIFMVPVKDRKRQTLLAIIKRWILPGTRIISDCWRASDTLADEGYQHENVNHTENFVDPESGAHTNGIDSAWNAAKLSISLANIKHNSLPGNLARYMLNKTAKALGRDPSVYFLELAGKVYNPLVDRQEEEDEVNEEEDEGEPESDSSNNSEDEV